MGSKKPAASEKSFALSEEERQARNKQLGGVGGTVEEAKGIGATTAAAVNPQYESYYGGGGLEPWKVGQKTLRTQATTSRFNDALAGTRRRSQLAGFGYEQPMSMAGENEVELGRAAELSRIPGEVEAEAVPIEMQALAGRQASGAQQSSLYNALAGTQLGVAGEYSPETYYGAGVEQDEAAKARKNALWRALIGSAAGVASAGLAGGSKP